MCDVRITTMYAIWVLCAQRQLFLRTSFTQIYATTVLSEEDISNKGDKIHDYHNRGAGGWGTSSKFLRDQLPLSQPGGRL